VLAGPDQIGWQKDLELLASNLGIADRITWAGMLKGKLKWGAYAASEIFVLPSHQENFGIVVAEALSCGLPVVISDKVNIWREIVSYWAGLVCDDTLDGTRSTLERWSELTAEEIAAARTRSLKCFDELFNFKATSKKVLAMYQYLVASNPRYNPVAPANRDH
jgi:glycosyltransferase involved in cell wall biosynthesis